MSPSIGGAPWDGGRVVDCYVVPDETLLQAEAAALAISGNDCFGGIVPHAFVGTKCVGHGLVGPGARRPAGWVETLGARLDGISLPGYSAFSLDDAQVAVERLLTRYGPIRLKAATGVGGGGQSVHADPGSAGAWLASLSPDALTTSGLVVELNLEEDVTWSIGTVRVGDFAAAYHGTQSTTTDNAGRTVYGGSRLEVVRGGWDELVALPKPLPVQEAVELARRFHDETFAAFSSLQASRCNYDVMVGRDIGGRRWTGVLEQSWRLGGASGAECAALLVFRDDPSRQRLVAASHERYGQDLMAPRGSQVLFAGDDPQAGPLIKYVEVDLES